MKIVRVWAVLWTVCLALGVAVSALAQGPVGGGSAAGVSIVGLWSTADEDSAKSIVRISDVNTKVTGDLVWVEGKSQSDVCKACAGSPKLLGLSILTGLKPEVSQPGQWSGGTLLNPKNGKTYALIASLVDNGQTLELDVSAGLFSKTVKWHRLSTDALKIYPQAQVAVGAIR